MRMDFPLDFENERWNEPPARRADKSAQISSIYSPCVKIKHTVAALEYAPVLFKIPKAHSASSRYNIMRLSLP